MGKRFYHLLIAAAVWMLPLMQAVGQGDVCPKPVSINLVGVTKTTAKLSWTLSGTGTPMSYDLRYGKEGAERVTLADIAASGEVFDLTNLEPSTYYVLDIRANCSDADKGYSEWSTLFRFSTLGDPATIPLTNNFNSETGTMPIGWFTSASTALAGNVGLANNDATYGTTQGRSVKLSASTEGIVDLVTSQLQHPANELEINFKYFATSNLKFSAGVRSNPFSNDYDPLFECEVTDVNRWVEVRMNTSQAIATAEGYCFAIVVPSGIVGDLYIDDIDIHEKPQCIRMETLTADKIDSTSITVSWFDYEMGGDYELYVNDQVTNIKGVANKDARGMENNMSYVITGLEKNTDYTIKVRTQCTPTDGSQNEWSKQVDVTTRCGTGPVVFKQDFEGADFPPYCWYQEQEGPGYWAATTLDGNKVMTLTRDRSQGDNPIKSRMILRPVHIAKAKDYDLHLRVYRGKNTRGPIDYVEDDVVNVYVNNVPTIQGATKLETIHDHHTLSPAVANSGWYEYYYNLDIQGTVYVIIEAVDVDWYGLDKYIDDIEIREAPACRMVQNVRFDSADDNSITITWDNGRYSEATEYMVDYTISPNHAPISAPVKVTGNKYKITGLQPGGQVYTIRAKVAAYCGAGNISEYTAETRIVEATKCEARTNLPLVENFTGSLFPPACWQTPAMTEKGEGVADTYEDKPWTAEGGEAFMRETNPGAKASLVMPLVDFGAAEGDYELTFAFRRGSGVGSPGYGYKTDDGLRVYLSESTSVEGAVALTDGLISSNYNAKPTPNIVYDGTPDEIWDPITIKFKAGGEKYIIFEGQGSMTTNTNGVADARIKNVRLQAKNDCGILNISYAYVGSITTTGAVVTLTDPSQAEYFDVKCGAPGFDPESEGTEFVSDGNGEAILSGLQPETDYQIYVRRDCVKSGMGQKGYWSEFPYSFRTACAGYAVTVEKPFFEGFEDGYSNGKRVEGCFFQEQFSDDYYSEWIAATSMYHYSGRYADFLPYEGEMMAYLGENRYRDGDAWLFYPFYFEKGVNYMVSAQVHALYGRDDETLTFALGEFPESGLMTSISNTELYGKEWTEVRGYLSVPESGTYYVGLHGTHHSGALLLDNFRVQVAYCVPPTASTVRNITPSSATIDFVSNATEWDIKVSLGRFTPQYEEGSVVNEEGITKKTYDVSGLMSNTEYFYSMRSKCDGQTSEWSPLASFRTECQKNEVPWYDALDSENNMPCWTIPDRTSESSVVADRDSYGRINYYWELDNVTIVSPEFIESLEGKVLSGWVKGDSRDDLMFSVGIVNADDDLMPVKDIPLRGYQDWFDFDVYFENLAEVYGEEHADDNRFFISISGGNVKIGELRLEVIPSCKKPDNPQITASSAFGFTMDWTPTGPETAWQIVARCSGEEDMVFDCNAHPYTATTGLLSATEYEMYLRTVCTDGTYSNEVYCGRYTTDCYEYPIPFDATFDGGNATCWEDGVILPDGGQKWVANSYNGTVQWSSNSSNEQTILSSIFSPKINVTGFSNLRLSFDAKLNAGTSETDKILQVYLWTDLDGEFDPEMIKLKRQVAELNVENFGKDNRNFITFSYDITKLAQYSKYVRVAFVGSKNPGTMDFAIDNFSVEDIGACLRPNNATFSDATENSVVMSITDTVPDHTRWQYVCVPAGSEVDLNSKFMPANATSKNVTITKTTKIGDLVAENLKGETLYDVYIRSNCGSSNYSAYRGPYSFRTACPKYPIPYKEGFDGMTSFASECWAEFESGRNEWNSDPVYSITTWYRDGKHVPVLELSGNYHNDLFCVALPQFDTPINQIKLRFDYKHMGTTDVYVGVMMKYGNMNTLAPVQLIPVSTEITPGYVVDFSLSKVANLDKAEAIVVYQSGRYKFQMDNVEVVPLNYQFEPTGLKVTGFTETDVTIEWNKVNGVDWYEYEVVNRATSAVAKTARVNVQDSITVEGLDMNTEYTFRLRVVGGATPTENEMPSEYSSIDFYTLAEIPELTYTTGFEDDEDNAKWVLGGQSSYNHFVFGTDKDAVRSGAKSLYITNDGVEDGKYGYNYTMSSYSYAYRTFEFTPGQYVISYTWRGVGDAYYDFGRVCLAPADIKPNEDDMLYYSTEYNLSKSCIPLDGVSNTLLNRQYDWKTITKELTIEDTVRYNFVILWTNDGANGSNPAFAIDDIEVRRINCQALENIDVVSVADCEAVISYVNRNEAPAPVRYAVTTSGNVEDAEGKWVTVSGDKAEIKGLTPNTAYTVFLDVECDVNEHSMPRSISFTTLQPAISALPFDCKFETAEEQSWALYSGRSINKFMYGNAASANDPDQDNMTLYISGDGGNYMYDNTKATTVYAQKLLNLEKGLYRMTYKWKSVGESGYDYGRVMLLPTDVVLVQGSMVGVPAGGMVLDNGQMSGKLDWTVYDKTFILKESAKYQLVIAWTNNGGSGGPQPVAIDNIYFEKLPCAEVTNLTLTDVAKTTAEFSFDNINESPVRYEVKKNGVTVKQATIPADQHTISLTDLEPATEYVIEIQAVCDEQNSSNVVSLNFGTECSPVEVTVSNPYIDDFEAYYSSQALSSCWIEDYRRFNESWTGDRWVVNTRETSNKRAPRSLRTNLTLRAHRESSITREFALQAGKYYEISVWALQSREADPSLSVVAMPADRSTTNTVYRCENISSVTYAKVAGYFRPDDAGSYWLGFYGVAGSSESDYLIIDDMMVRELGNEAPLNVQVDEITKTSAHVSWAGNSTSYDVELYRRGVKVDGKGAVNHADTEMDFDGLDAATNYEVKVRAKYSNGEYSEWVTVMFTTDCGITELPYAMNFNDDMPGEIPACWSNANSWLTDMKLNWAIANEGNERVMMLPASSAFGTAVLETPLLSNVVEGQWLTFRYRNNTVADRLTVKVSTDAGVTYTEANKFADFGSTNGWEIKRFSLDKFAGQSIVVAFEVSLDNPDGLGNSVAIDDVRFVCAEQDRIIKDETCSGMDYNGTDFYIISADLRPGEVNVFEKIVEADFDNPDAAVRCDRYVRLELNVKRSPMTIINHTMCEGDVYMKEPFDDKEYTRTGSYIKTYEPKKPGDCDSIVRLNLTVLPSVEHMEKEICEGDYFEFEGKNYQVGEYEIPGVHELGDGRTCNYVTKLTVTARPKTYDYYAYFCEGSKYTWPVNNQDYDKSCTDEVRYITAAGCDSICILHLEMLPARTSFNATICSGGQYIWGEGADAEVFTTGGRHEKTFKNVLGCDSVVTMFLSVNPPIEADVNDYVCEGYPYEGHGLNIPRITKDTIIVRTSQTDELCDSTTRLHIEFVPTVRKDSLYQLKQGETIVFNGQSINSPGTYPATFRTDLGCDSILTLVVTMADALDNIYALPLVVAPNPVSGGETTYVNRSWSVDERNGLTVEVVNSVGQIISRIEPAVYPIEIKSPDVSGVYYIRVLSGTGELHVGKLIVR